jgi:hypothetical protein
MDDLEVHTSTGEIFPLTQRQLQGFWTPYGALGHSDYVPLWYFVGTSLIRDGVDWWLYDSTTGEYFPTVNHNAMIDWSVGNSDLDSDGDGLPDWYEKALGFEWSGVIPSGATHPIGWDTDGDGLDDGWEIRFGLLPKTVDSGQLDADGFAFLEEYQNGTSPEDPAPHINLTVPTNAQIVP